MHDLVAVTRALWIVHEQLEKAVAATLDGRRDGAAVAEIAAISIDLTSQLVELSRAFAITHVTRPSKVH